VEVASGDVLDTPYRAVWRRWRGLAVEGDLSWQQLVSLIAVTQTTEHAEPKRIGFAVARQDHRVGRARRHLDHARSRGVEEGDASRLEAGRPIAMTQPAMLAFAKREDLMVGRRGVGQQIFKSRTRVRGMWGDDRTLPLSVSTSEWWPPADTATTL
jgi:hypothetical protein